MSNIYMCGLGLEKYHCSYKIGYDMENHDKEIYLQGYSNAIDDFSEAVKTAVTEMDDISAYDNPNQRIYEILQIESERLKVGEAE